MYRTKSYNNNHGDQQLWIKVDLKEIRFYPSRDIIRKFQCRQIELLFKYTSLNIGINFIEGREVHEIRIPLDQITRFRVIQNKQIDLEFVKDFKRTHFVHFKNQNSNIVNKTQKDPTSGCIKDATKLTFTPCDKVHPMTIFMFEVGIKKWAPRLIESEGDKDDIQIHEDLIIEDSPPLSPFPSNIISEYLITCNFMDFTRDIRLPAEITYSDLLKEINRNLECDINTFKYKINDEEMVMVENEGDWNIAKMNLNEQKISCFDIYIVE